MYLKYVCENESCEEEGIVREVRPDRDAEGATQCPNCGWFMAAI